MKKNIGQKLALYPTPATVVGTVGEDGKVNWLLIAHIGIVSHSKILLSVHSSHHSVKAIDEQHKLSVNIIDETFVAAADYTGTVSGKSGQVGHLSISYWRGWHARYRAVTAGDGV